MKYIGLLLTVYILFVASCQAVGTEGDAPTHTVLIYGNDVPLYSYEMDYYEMEDGVVLPDASDIDERSAWSDVPLPKNTKIVVYGRSTSWMYESIENGNEEGKDNDEESVTVSVTAFSMTGAPKGVSAFKDIDIYKFRYEEIFDSKNSPPNRKEFNYGHYYLFCFDRDFPKRKDDGEKGGRRHEMSELASHINAIIEIVPIYKFTGRNPVFHLEVDRLVSWKKIRYERDGSSSEGYSLVKSENGFEWRFDGMEGTVSPDSKAFTKLCYAVNTIEWLNVIEWQKYHDLSLIDEYSPSDSIMKVISDDQSERELRIKYNNGTWYFQDIDGSYYFTGMFGFAGTFWGDMREQWELAHE